MKSITLNNITKTNRGIATVLLLSQLLTSCGGFKEALIVPNRPSPEPMQSTCFVPLQEDCGANASIYVFQMATTTLEGTHLIFHYSPEQGMKVTYQIKADNPHGINLRALPVQQCPLIPTTNGVLKPFTQLTAAEAMLLAREGKWEVSADGALRYLGMRGRGGMQNHTPQPLEEEEEVIIPISCIGINKTAYIYKAPAGKTITGYHRKIDKARSSQGCLIAVRTFTQGEAIDLPSLKKAGYQLQGEPIQNTHSDRLLLQITIPDHTFAKPGVTGELKLFLAPANTMHHAVPTPPIHSRQPSLAVIHPPVRTHSIRSSHTSIASSNHLMLPTDKSSSYAASDTNSYPSKGLKHHMPKAPAITRQATRDAQSPKPKAAIQIPPSVNTSKAAKQSANKHHIHHEALALPLSHKNEELSKIRFRLLPPSSKEIARVQAYFLRTCLSASAIEQTPADKQEKLKAITAILQIEKIRSKHMLQVYTSRKLLLDGRSAAPIFDPEWQHTTTHIAAKQAQAIAAEKAKFTKELTPEEEAKINHNIQQIHANYAEKLAKATSIDTNYPFRKAVHDHLMHLVSASHLHKSIQPATGVKELWLWHGTSSDSAKSIMKIGFASLATRDDGFYGKGIYFSSNLASIQKAYAPKVLLLCRVCFYAAYPVFTPRDIKDLYNKSNHGSYDAHYVPAQRRLLTDEEYQHLTPQAHYRSIPLSQARRINHRPQQESQELPLRTHSRRYVRSRRVCRLRSRADIARIHGATHQRRSCFLTFSKPHSSLRSHS